MNKKTNILILFFKVLEIISRTIFTLLGLGILAGLVFIAIGFSRISKENDVYNDSAGIYDLDQAITKDTPRVQNANIILFDPFGTIKETYSPLYKYTDITQEVLYNINSSQKKNIISLTKIQSILDDIKNDNTIEAIVFDYTNVHFENDLVREKIMKSLQDLQKIGKKIITVADIDFSTYMVASVSDAFIIDDIGSYILNGYSTSPNLYFKGLLDTYGIEVTTAHVGKYKSAIENATRTDMSVEARENIESIYSDFWDKYLSYVAQNRQIDKKIILNYINNYDNIYKKYLGDMAQAAVDMKLASHIYNGGNKLKFISSVISDISSLNLAEIQYQNFEDYAGHKEDSEYLNDEKIDYNIVILPLTGEIQYGLSTETSIGLDSVISLVEKLKADDKIRALVLRMNSPGGSSEVSAKIRRELLDLKRERSIPIIVSMGELNASGGYYISTAAEYMLSEPFTITGSIGVFLQQYTYEKTLKNFGITTDSYETTWLDNAYSPVKNPTERIKNLYRLSTEFEYNRFIQYVAEARNIPIERVDTIAQGRVYTGLQAYQLGLADELGGLEAAIHAAAEKANIAQEDVAVHYMLPNIAADFNSTITNILTQYLKSQLLAVIKNISTTFFNQKIQL